jgi:hypothetical protein
MTRHRWSLLVLALACACAARAPAQEPVLYSTGATGQFITLAEGPPDGTAAPIFAPDGAAGVRAGGTVSGLGIAQPGAARSDVHNIAIGFDYLCPLWTFNDFTLVVPAANARSFPLLGDTGHVDDHFGFAPLVKYNYRLDDFGLGVGVSGQFLNLSGHLERGLSLPPLGLAVLRASANLTLLVANIAEVTQRIFLEDVIEKDKPCLKDLVLDLSLGTRYASLTQNYDSSLFTNNGFNSSTRHAEQSFQGFGLTGAVNSSLPTGHDWVFFWDNRWSVLVGNNIKRGTLALQIQGDPVNSQTFAIDENKTVFLPVGELELGVAWGKQLADRLRANQPPPQFTLRASFVGQFWGNVGPFSAGVSTQGFRESDLFLIGVNVTAGLYF